MSFGRSIEEHMHTRQKACLFDVSHMGEIEVDGPAAEPFIDHVLTNAVKSIKVGKAVYSPI